MIDVVVDNIAFVDADAVVRPATDTLEPTSSVLRPLERLGGAAFLKLLETRVSLGVGSATVTGGGELASEFVIHAIIRSVSEPVSPSGVRRALASALHQAAAWQFAALALPPVGTGPGNLPIEDAAKIMCEVVREHLRTQAFPSVIKIVVESDEDKAIFDALLRVGES